MPGKQRIIAPPAPRTRAKQLLAKKPRTPQENEQLVNLLADIVLNDR